MKKITWISVSAALIFGVLMFGSFEFGRQTSTQASIQIPQDSQITQEELPPQELPGVTDEQWITGPFRALVFEERAWQQVSSEGGCLIYRSIGAADNPATITVMGSDREVRRSYTKLGARVQVCGLTVHLPPASSGISASGDDN